MYKLDNNFYMARKEISYEHAVMLIEDFYQLGARKLTLMGGEPTLYGIEEGRKPFFNLIERARELGYEYIRIDTNGQFETTLLEEPAMKKLDEITFSLDGPTAEINDPIRGEGSFDKAVANIKRAVELGYNVNITSCIHNKMIERNEEGNLYLDQMIHFTQDIGVTCINFHDLFKGGIPRDFWSGNIDITVNQWFEVWEELQKKIENNEYDSPVRIPQSFVSKEEFDTNPDYYGYCSAKTGDRILVHPNGIMRVCSLMIGTPYGVAKYYDDKIVWDEGYTNELAMHDMNAMTPCTNQSKSKCYGCFVPLCVSFKPKQNEFIWKLKLEWEKYRNK